MGKKKRTSFFNRPSVLKALYNYGEEEGGEVEGKGEEQHRRRKIHGRSSEG